MEIGKPAVTGGPDPASLYKQRAEAEKTGVAPEECGECQAQKTGPDGRQVSALVEISPEALARVERQEALQLAKDIYDRLPDTRQEVISRVKQKLEEGYYDSQSVKNELTERLTDVVKRMETTAGR